MQGSVGTHVGVQVNSSVSACVPFDLCICDPVSICVYGCLCLQESRLNGTHSRVCEQRCGGYGNMAKCRGCCAHLCEPPALLAISVCTQEYEYMNCVLASVWILAQESGGLSVPLHSHVSVLHHGWNSGGLRSGLMLGRDLRSSQEELPKGG